MAGDQLRAYQQMTKELRVWMESMDGDEIHTKKAVVLVQLLRLSEITSGFVRDDKGVAHWFKDHAKGKALDEIVTDHMPDKLVIFCHWRPECIHYAERYKEHGTSILFGGIEGRDRDAIIEEFRTSPSLKILVCQESSGGIGIDLSAAALCVYASRSWSLEAWLQSNDRLRGPNQKREVGTLTLQARSWIDTRIAAVLEDKEDTAEVINRDSLKEEAA